MQLGVLSNSLCFYSNSWVWFQEVVDLLTTGNCKNTNYNTWESGVTTLCPWRLVVIDHKSKAAGLSLNTEAVHIKNFADFISGSDRVCG